MIHPCLQCYMKPEWEQERRNWADWYLYNHRGGRDELSEEVVEELSGVGLIPRRVGLVNIVREMDEMDRGRV